MIRACSQRSTDSNKRKPGDLNSEDSSAQATPRGDVFATTRWTVVLEAGDRGTPQSDRALEELCRAYWYPLYAYIRRRERSKEDAEDLTQAFFAGFLEKNYLEGLSAERGRFRAFLLASLKHFLANERDRAKSVKRGGGVAHLSLDWSTADTQFQVAQAAELSPDRAFDREWAMALLARVIGALSAECAAEGRSQQFETLRVFLTAGKGAWSHAEAAQKLEMEEGAVRTAVHRLRKRYRHLLREAIAQTLSDPAQVADEMQSLFGAFGH